MVVPVVKEPNVILHRKAERVQQVTPDVRRMVRDMIETMYAAEGVGLAANQIGLPWDILVAHPDRKNGKELVLLNAVVTEREGRSRTAEGCLSLPGVSADVTRAASVTVNGLDMEGQPVILQAEGLLAKILQHETDHLSGHLYVDHLGFLQRQQILQKYKKLSRTLGRIKI